MQDAVNQCPTCGFNLRTILVIESMDEELADKSGMYCPMCFAEEVVSRAPAFERLNREYTRKRVLTGGFDSAIVLPASA